MGNLLLQSTLKSFPVYHSHSAWDDWHLIQSSNQKHLNKLVKNKRNPNLIGELRLSKHIHNLQNALRISQFRYDLINQPIVGIHGIYSSFNSPNFTHFCGTLQNYTIVTQHVKYCIGDLGQLSFKKSIQILKNALYGAKLMKQFLRILPIYDENMIFFDTFDNCKVWINPDINSCSSPYENLPIKESDSVNSIFMTIEEKTQPSSEFLEFLRQKSTIHISSFEQALNFVQKFFRQSSKQNNCIQIGHEKSYQKAKTNQDEIIRKVDLKKQTQNQNKQSNKKSLSVKKVVKQTEPCVFFSAKKTNNRHSEDNQNCKPTTRQFISLPINFHQFLPNQKPFFPLKTTKNGPLKVIVPRQELKTQTLFQDSKTTHELKKKIINRNEIKEKFIDSRLKQNQMNSKPSSALSTQYDSEEVSTKNASRMEPNGPVQKMQQLKFTKKHVNRLKSPIAKLDIFKNQNQHCSRNNSSHKLDECFSERKQDDEKKYDRKYVSDKNIPNVPSAKKISIATRTPKLGKQASMPAFFKIDNWISA